MFSKVFILATLFLLFGNLSEENMRYYKEYYQTGKPKAEGWVKSGAKTGYWKFYHDNGSVAEKGANEMPTGIFMVQIGSEARRGITQKDKKPIGGSFMTNLEN